MKTMKTAAALRASDTSFLHQDSMPKLIAEITKPVIMDEQDEIDMLKAIIKENSAAILRLKREAAALLHRADEAYSGNTEWMMHREREALRKALSEVTD